MATIGLAAAVPAPEQAQAILMRFACSTAALTIQLADSREQWLKDAAREAAEAVRQLDVRDVAPIFDASGEPEFLYDVATSILFREIVHADRLYDDITRAHFPNAPDIPSDLYPEIAPDPTQEISKADVDRVEVIYGSIEKLLDKLPVWLRRIFNVAMELLKLARGIAD